MKLEKVHNLLKPWIKLSYKIMKNIFLRDGLGRISTLSKNSAGTNINNLNVLQRSKYTQKV